ncbi:MAG: lipase maturation factor family protein [Verrucomicrobia bacterium]|nr:lipase maturation factor family protein [Verrucomicrobiota bacterium]
MLLIAATGNYTFFNLLTLALCLPLVDDGALRKIFGTLGMRRSSRGERGRGRRGAGEKGSGGDGTAPAVSPPPPFPLSPLPPAGRWWDAKKLAALGLAAALIFLASGGIFFSQIFHAAPPWPVGKISALASPFRSINGYGLFAVMTPTRPEIIVEGSNDGVTWLAYEFKWKAGDLKRAPGFVAPHQPRLDWQMWFGALGEMRGNPWFVSFVVRLLQGSPETLALLESNPFPNAPPRFIRAQLYEYHFTDYATRRATGEWWRRELKGVYCPPVSLTK